MSETTRPSRWKKILRNVFIGVAVLLVLIAITLSSVATNIANKQLPKQLGTNAELKNVQINALAGRFALNELTIEQPEGFSHNDEPLLTLGQIVAYVPIRKAIDQNPILVRSVHLSDMTLNLVMDTNVVLNVSQLGPTAQEEPAAEPEPEPEPTAEEEPAAVPPVWVKHVLLENIKIAFHDYDRDWGIDLEDIQFDIKDLQLSEQRADGPALVEGHVYFHSEKASGRLKLHAKIGVITPDQPETVPPVQLAVGLIGFDLDLVEPFLVPSPAVAKTAFGGSGFDFKLFMQIANGASPSDQAISGSFELVTDKGQRTKGKLGGNVAEPVLPFTTLFADILGNQFGRAFSMTGNVAQGGLEAGKAVGETGVAVVKGAGKTVGGLAGGLLKTAKGVVTLDADEAMGGLSDATVGTAKNAAGTVGDAASTAGEGLKDTAGTVTGGDDVKTWWASVNERQQAFDTEAMTWFDNNPFETLPPSPEQTVSEPVEQEASSENVAPQKEEEEDDDDDEPGRSTSD